MINEEIFNPIEKKKEVQHYTCTDIISDINPDALFADGFDAAIIGYDANCTVVYDYDKCMKVLMERDGMTKQDAHEYLNWEFQLSGWFQELPTGGFRQSVRINNWKAVRYGVDNKVELYNLQDDPSESKDLAVQYPETVSYTHLTLPTKRIV